MVRGVPGCRPGRPVPQRRLGSRAHRAGQPGTVGVRVDGTVEHEPVNPVREHLHVHGAQVRAVRPANVGHLRLAERGPHGVHVPGGVAGTRVRQHVRVAALRQRLRERHALLERAPGRAGPAQRGVGRPPAGKPSAAADEARVHVDQVVRGREVRRTLGDRDRQPERRVTRPARVEQECAPAMGRVAGRQPGDGDRDGPPVRVAVVQRYPDLGASGAGGVHRGADLVVRAGLAAVPLERGRRGDEDATDGQDQHDLVHGLDATDRRAPGQ